MTKAKNDKKVVNVKFDAETKSKLESFAFIERCSVQDLCYNIITEAIGKNADAIAKAEKLRK